MQIEDDIIFLSQKGFASVSRFDSPPYQLNISTVLLRVRTGQYLADLRQLSTAPNEKNQPTTFHWSAISCISSCLLTLLWETDAWIVSVRHCVRVDTISADASNLLYSDLRYITWESYPVQRRQGGWLVGTRVYCKQCCLYILCFILCTQISVN